MLFQAQVRANIIDANQILVESVLVMVVPNTSECYGDFPARARRARWVGREARRARASEREDDDGKREELPRTVGAGEIWPLGLQVSGVALLYHLSQRKGWSTSLRQHDKTILAEGGEQLGQLDMSECSRRQADDGGYLGALASRTRCTS